MILYAIADKLYEVPLAFLNLIDSTQAKARYFSTSEQVISFLKNSPSKMFSLSPALSANGQSLQIATGIELTFYTSFDAYGPEFGDVLCGVVSYDPAKAQVLTIGTYLTTNGNRIWSG